MALTVIAAYDVSEDDRRARLAALLQTYGDRIQKSVFVIMVDHEELAQLADHAGRLVDIETDSVWFLRQCTSCWTDALTVGQAKSPDRTLFWAVL